MTQNKLLVYILIYYNNNSKYYFYCRKWEWISIINII